MLSLTSCFPVKRDDLPNISSIVKALYVGFVSFLGRNIGARSCVAGYRSSAVAPMRLALEARRVYRGRLPACHYHQPGGASVLRIGRLRAAVLHHGCVKEFFLNDFPLCVRDYSGVWFAV